MNAEFNSTGIKLGHEPIHKVRQACEHLHWSQLGSSASSCCGAGVFFFFLYFYNFRYANYKMQGCLKNCVIINRALWSPNPSCMTSITLFSQILSQVFSKP